MRLKNPGAACALLFTLFCFGLSACQPLANKKTAQPQPPVEADIACSYFYFLWGRNAELRMQFDEALEAYEKAVICDDKAAYVQDKIPMLLLRLNRAAEAAQWLRQYLWQHPDNVSMRMLYARILLGQRNLDGAMQQYQLMLESHPDDPAVTLPLAEMYLAGGHSDQARTVLRKILRHDSHSYQALLLMARLLRSEKKMAEAREYYQQALELNWSAEVQSEEAELLVQNREYDEAEAMYREIIEREEQNESAYLGLIRLYLQQNREDRALRELQALRQFADKPLWVDLFIARFHMKQGKYQEARQLLEQILNREDVTEARYLFALLLQQEKQYEEALRQVRMIDHKAPEFQDALELRVSLLKELNRGDDAVLFLEHNIANPVTRFPAMYRLLATLHDSQGRSAMARKVLEEGIDHFPGDDELLYTYGLFLEEKGEHDDALAIMEKIVALNPQNAAALNFVGYSWADKGVHLKRALDYLQRAITLKPDNGYIRDSLGWVLYRLGRLDEALRELEQARLQTENDPTILEHLAEVSRAAGKNEAALKIYKQLLRHYSDSANETARRAIQQQIDAIDNRTAP